MVNLIFHADHAGNACQFLTECILRGLHIRAVESFARKLMM